MKRDATAVIWRTVVFAGAMLGAPACSKSKPATTTPQNTAQKTGGDNGMAPTNGSAAKPDTNDGGGDPCAGGPAPRPRTNDDDNGGGMGRGFVLS